MLYPPQANLLEVELSAAGKIAALIFERGLARAEKAVDPAALIRSLAYQPRYPSFVEARASVR
jgi:malate dehydrogenase (oxaloacetate-decarboxylating)(NADP+)